jgi:hypothetical protein
MKRKCEMRKAAVGEIDELAKKYGSEDSKKGGDSENMQEFGTK